MKVIKTGQNLTARSVCDHNCIFTIKVIERKGQWSKVLDFNRRVRRLKVREFDGDEFVQPERYSMAPMFFGEDDTIPTVNGEAQ